MVKNRRGETGCRWLQLTGGAGFEASDLFPNEQILLLSFLVTLVKAIHLCGNFVKPFNDLISKRANLRLQFLTKKQTQSFHLVF